jgi:hypothetical protein
MILYEAHDLVIREEKPSRCFARPVHLTHFYLSSYILARDVLIQPLLSSDCSYLLVKSIG